MDFNDIIGYSLRIGVLISAALLVFGILLLFINNGSNGLSLSQITALKSPINSSIITPAGVVEGVQTLNPISIIFLGLMVLIATPVLRIVLGIMDFAKQRDALYTIITVIVLFNVIFAIAILPYLVGK